jgi:membrane-associated phospholipid phosphatase
MFLFCHLKLFFEMQFATFVLAVHICLTRVTDFKHHATDVLAGSVLGIVVAITVTLFLLNLRKYPSIFFQSILEEEEDESDGRAKRRQTEELCTSKI